MINHFLQTVTDAEAKKWCVRPWCTTCGARDFRAAVASIEDLQLVLETIDLKELSSYRDWCDALRITAIEHGVSLDWGRILSSWLPFAQNDIDFADHVFYYLVNRVPCDRQTRDKWLETCIGHAIKTKHISLLESLVQVLGSEVSTYNDLMAAALEQSPNSQRLRGALVKAGLVPSEDDLRQERKSKLAGHNLFGAIRRNDIKAVRALIARGADLRVKGEKGKTPVEYARSLEHGDLVSILESAIAHQVSSSTALDLK